VYHHSNRDTKSIGPLINTIQDVILAVRGSCETSKISIAKLNLFSHYFIEVSS